MAKVKLGILIQDIRGKAGNAVMAKHRSGIVARQHVIPNDPKTTAQLEARKRFAVAAAQYKSLTAEQAEQWKNYARSLASADPVTSQITHPTAIAAFTALATKFLQINPNADIPTTPPAQDFKEDDILITATPLQNAIRFTASAPNAANSKTELLLQPLPSRNRAPEPRAYKTQTFVRFTQNSQTFDLPIEPGIYAPAYRFVNPQTGQQTQLIPLNTITVP